MQKPKLSDATVVRQSDECAWQAIRGKIIVVYPRDREIHRLNETASAIWQYIEKPRTVKEVARHVAAEFDVSESAADADARQFLAELLEKNLILLKN